MLYEETILFYYDFSDRHYNTKSGATGQDHYRRCFNPRFATYNSQFTIPFSMNVLQQYLIVGAAGSLGAMLRLLVARICAHHLGTAFPYGTLIINVTGSLFLGWFMAHYGSKVVETDALRLAASVGFVGAYTTFSTFAYETDALYFTAGSIKAMVYIIASVALGLIAVRVGIGLGMRG